MKNLLKIGALAVALVGMTNVAGAQASLPSSLNATATIGADISITPTDLVFGTVYRNQGPRAIAATSAGAGHFVIAGTGATSPIATVGTLPTVLTSTSSSATLPVVFSFSTLAAGTGVCTGTVTDGSSPITVLLDGTAGAGGLGKLCVGGTVTPGASQAIEDYTAAVTITVAFP